MNKKQKKGYEEFTNEQFRILRGHFERGMLRCANKYAELKYSKGDKGVKNG